jgi:hypothetical protein
LVLITLAVYGRMGAVAQGLLLAHLRAVGFARTTEVLLLLGLLPSFLGLASILQVMVAFIACGWPAARRTTSEAGAASSCQCWRSWLQWY